MKEEFLFCPFCGGDARPTSLNTGVQIFHKKDCFLSKNNLFPNNEFWVSKWNRRSAPKKESNI